MPRRLTPVTKLLDSQIKSQVDLIRYEEHLQRKVVKLLNQAQKSIIADIAKKDPTMIKMTAWRQKRLQNLNKSIGGIMNNYYGKIKKTVDTELKNLAAFTGKETVAHLNNAIGAEIANVTLTQEGLKAIVNNTMIDGQIIGKWWDDQKADVKKRLARQMADATQAVQLGLVRGEGVGELIRRVRGTKLTPGVMSISKNNADALVRTSVMQVASDARMTMYDANRDLIRGFEAVATLDRRTTPRCLIDGDTPIQIWERRSFPAYKSIKDIQLTDLVLTHRGRFKKVTKLIFTPEQMPDVVTLVIGGVEGNVVELPLTRDHPVLLEEGWVFAGKIKVGDNVKVAVPDPDSYPYRFKNQPIIYVKRWKVDKPITLYNLEVEKDESYTAKVNGFVVHNCRAYDGKRWIEDGKPPRKAPAKDVEAFKADNDLGAVGNARTHRVMDPCY